MGPPLADGAHLARAARAPVSEAPEARHDGVHVRRLASQLLAGPRARTPEAVAERLLAIQAQDPRGARLAIRARSAVESAAEVDRALDGRRMVVSWLNRGTLHLVRAEDYWWLHALTTPPLLTPNARRLAQTGVSPAAAERGVETIERALREEGPLSRRELRDRLQARDVPTADQALVHVLMLACLRGVAVRGPMKGREQAYAPARDWLGAPPRVERDLALAELARRYLRGHAPADERDLARWAGLPLRDARAGFGAIAAELRDAGGGLLELRSARRAPVEPASLKLLGAFEPLLLGWCSREAILGAAAERVVTGGIFRPFALSGTRAVATWRVRGREVEVEPFAPLAEDAAGALAAEREAVRRFLALGPA